MFNFIQWNCGGFYARLPQLQKLIVDRNPDVLCIQETNFQDKHVPTLRGYQAYCQNRTNPLRASGGAAILVSDKYSTSQYPITTKFEAVAVRMYAPSEVTVCCLYLPNSQTINEESVSELISQLPRPFLLLGDFNANHQSWGSSKTDARGRVIQNVILNSNIVLLNGSESTHLCLSSGSFSSIDLSFADPISSTFYQWSVIDHLYGSDHFPIEITDSRTQVPEPEEVPVWKLKSADWTRFAKSIAAAMAAVEFSGSIDEQLELFNTVVIQSAERSVGRSPRKFFRKSVPWWNDSCGEANTACKRALNYYRHHRTEENLTTLKRCRAQAKRIIRESKRESWESYVSNLTSDTAAGEVWDKISRIKGSRRYTHIATLRDSNGDRIRATPEIAETMSKTFAEFSSDVNYTGQFLSRKRIKEQDETFDYSESQYTSLNDPINMNELIEVLKNSKHSAAGPDDIPNVFLKNLPPIALEKLLSIFNVIWTRHTFPAIWRKAVVIPIHKPGKPKEEVSSYRPISLTCAAGKLLEGIINKRLLWYLEQHHLISEVQNGFRPNRSTSDGITHLHTEATQAFVNGQSLIAVFFDLKRAFDTTWRAHIMHSLREMGLGGNLLYYIGNFLQNRTFRTKVGSYLSASYVQENGVPQGSVISPTLFSVALNSIADTVISPVKMSVYADDIVIYCRGSNISTATQLLQDTIERMEKWADTTGFSFSPEKTKCMVFSRRNRPATLNLKLLNAPLEQVKEYTFLGVLFDARLSWLPHINKLRAECLRRISILRVLANHHWGANETVLLSVYRALVRSKLDYGCTVYGTARQSVLKRLDMIQHCSLRLILGAHRTSPRMSLYRESGEIPLDLRRRQIMAAFAIKIAAQPNNPNYETLIAQPQHRESFTQHPRSPVPYYMNIQHHLTDQEVSSVTPIETGMTPWKTILRIDTSLTTYRERGTPPSSIAAYFRRTLNSHPHEVEVYTDASKGVHGVGCSVITPTDKLRFKLPIWTSVHTGELYAIKEALAWFLYTAYQSIVICTDSLSSLQSLQRRYSTHKLVQEIHGLCQRLEGASRKVAFLWTPSHCGVEGNEEADGTAREAEQGPELSDNILLHQDIKNEIRSRIKKSWQQLWSVQNTQLKMIEASTIHRRLISYSRREGVIIRRLRIGHTAMTHDHILKKTVAPTCSTCNVQITVEHIILGCARFDRERVKYGIAGSLENVLNLETTKATGNLLDFLRSVGLYSFI